MYSVFFTFIAILSASSALGNTGCPAAWVDVGRGKRVTYRPRDLRPQDCQAIATISENSTSDTGNTNSHKVNRRDVRDGGYTGGVSVCASGSHAV
jgi:hypothetical protein